MCDTQCRSCHFCVGECCSCTSSVESSDTCVTTTWRGVIDSADTVGVSVGLFNSTFTVSCVDRSATVRTAKVTRAGEFIVTDVFLLTVDDSM